MQVYLELATENSRPPTPEPETTPAAAATTFCLWYPHRASAPYALQSTIQKKEATSKSNPYQTSQLRTCSQLNSKRWVLVVTLGKRRKNSRCHLWLKPMFEKLCIAFLHWSACLPNIHHHHLLLLVLFHHLVFPLLGQCPDQHWTCL